MILSQNFGDWRNSENKRILDKTDPWRYDFISSHVFGVDGETERRSRRRKKELLPMGESAGVSVRV